MNEEPGIAAKCIQLVEGVTNESKTQLIEMNFLVGQD